MSLQSYRDLRAVSPTTSVQSDLRVNPRLSLGQVKTTVHLPYQGLPGSRKLTGRMLSQPNIPRGAKVRTDKALVQGGTQMKGSVTLTREKSLSAPLWMLAGGRSGLSCGQASNRAGLQDSHPRTPIIGGSYLLFSFLLHTSHPLSSQLCSSRRTCCCPFRGRVDRISVFSLECEQDRPGDLYGFAQPEGKLAPPSFENPHSFVVTTSWHITYSLVFNKCCLMS